MCAWLQLSVSISIRILWANVHVANAWKLSRYNAKYVTNLLTRHNYLLPPPPPPPKHTPPLPLSEHIDIGRTLAWDTLAYREVHGHIKSTYHFGIREV